MFHYFIETLKFILNLDWKLQIFTLIVTLDNHHN